MRPLLPLLLVAVLPACSLNFGGGYKKEASYEVGFDAAGAEAIRIEGYNGPLTVRAGAAGEVVGESTLYALAASPEAAQERLVQMTWEADLDGNTLVVTLKKPDDSRREFGGSLALTVPATWNVDLDTSNGSVTVDGDFPKVLVATSNGRLDLRTDGLVRARTSNGRIEFRGASQDFDLRTSNGRVTAVLAGDFEGSGRIRTSNGRVSVECAGNLAASLSMSTSNGSRSVDGPTPAGEGTLSIETSNGSISVRHSGPAAGTAGGGGAATR